jgi:carbonic anhydrase/acetyltransferase-like protein (isoleucine patch superfamily)
MRIGDDNLFEIGCRASCLPSVCPPTYPAVCLTSVISVLTRVPFCVLYIGVESPSVGNFNTVSTRARVHHTVRISSYCVIGAGCLVVPTDDEVLDEYTVIYGPSAERRVWSGRGRVQEADLRRKHAEYLRETLPKFNRLRRGDAHGYGA